MGQEDYITTADLAMALLRFLSWEEDVQKYKRAGKPGMASRRAEQACRAGKNLAETLAAYRICHGKDPNDGEEVTSGPTHHDAI